MEVFLKAREQHHPKIHGRYAILEDTGYFLQSGASVWSLSIILSSAQNATVAIHRVCVAINIACFEGCESELESSNKTNGPIVQLLDSSY